MSESEKGEVIDARTTVPKETPSKRRRLPLKKRGKMLPRKKGNNEDDDTTSLRRSSRLPSLDGLPVKDQIAFEAKNLDGHEAERNSKTLQAIVHYKGDPPYLISGGDAMRNRVNNLRRGSQHGKAPCYDILDSRGSMIYAYSLPLAPMACILQGVKNESSLAQYKKETKILNSFKPTSYMFLHWTGGVESSMGDYKSHDFVKSRPGLAIAIESLGNFFARRVLQDPELGDKLQPGLLCNSPTIETQSSCQGPHWDFIGWRKVKAQDMPWVVHIPLCREGMMLHVWPTERDELTHRSSLERFKLGKPKLIHVGFGDALVLRADVCHGGCFGSAGNMRFHMILRKEGCALATDKLHFLERSGVDPQSYQDKYLDLQNLPGEGGTFDSYFRQEVKRKSKTVLAYTKAIESLYPEVDNWCDPLLSTVTF